MEKISFEEILEWVAVEQGRLFENAPPGDMEKRALRQLAKLTEEVGELSDAVLSHFGVQRKDKLDKYDQEEDLKNELADVVIVALMLANLLGVDIEEAIGNKIEKINKRYNRNV